jgi:phosphoglycerate kinase
LDVAKEIVQKYSDKLVLPSDHLIADEFNEYSSYEYLDTLDIPEDKLAIDIGQGTIDAFKEVISTAQTVLWNGPMGVFEWQHSESGTKEIGKTVSEAPGYKVIGGGDTITAIHKFDISGFDHICTGGGAMLAFLSYEKFPTLDVILEKN